MLSFSGDRRRLGRLALIAVAAVAAVLAVLLVPPWLRVVATPSTIRRWLIAFLDGLEMAYCAAFGALGLGAVLFGLAVWRGRRRRAARPLMARGLLTCAVGLAAALVAEGVAAGWQAWTHRIPGLAPGELTIDARFAETSPADEVTVAVLGESSAEGMPFEEWLSVGKIVTWQLGRSIPSRRFRLEPVAHRGDTLADQYRKLAEVRRRPDILIVYCGHNEFAARFPWSRRVDHYLDEGPSASWRLEEEAARVSPLCGLIHETADRFRIATRPTKGSAPPLVDAPAYTPGEFAARLADFRARLEAIADFGERIHALTVLVVPPANDAAFDPNRSFLPAETPRAERAAFARDFEEARRSEGDDLARAIAGYRRLLGRQPAFAETHYRLGELLARAGAWDEAYRHFVEARDLDGLPMRCPGALQQAYRDVAAGHPRSTMLVDGQVLFHAIGEHGLLGDDLFMDAMHPSLRGHIALAQAILEALYARRAAGWDERAPPPLVDPAECAAHFGLEPSVWRSMSHRGAMFLAATAPLRYDPTARESRRDAFLRAAGRLDDGESVEAVGLPNLGVPAATPLAPESPARRAR